MTPGLKRLLFPLRAPRCQSLLFHPVSVFAAAVDGYFEAFFAAPPPGRNRITHGSTAPAPIPEDIQ